MINLSPPVIRQSIKYGRLNVKVVSYIIGVGLVAVLIAITIYVGIRITNDKQADLDAELASRNLVFDEYKETLADAQELSQTINTIKVLLEREVK